MEYREGDFVSSRAFEPSLSPGFITLLLVFGMLLLAGCSQAVWDALAASGGDYSWDASDNTRSFSSSGTTCPSCGSGMYFTGEITVEWGKLLKLYRCPVGHSYWYPTSSPSRTSYETNLCPICGMGTHFTGETREEFGNLQKFYKCPVGHLSVK